MAYNAFHTKFLNFLDKMSERSYSFALAKMYTTYFDLSPREMVEKFSDHLSSTYLREKVRERDSVGVMEVFSLCPVIMEFSEEEWDMIDELVELADDIVFFENPYKELVGK